LSHEVLNDKAGGGLDFGGFHQPEMVPPECAADAPPQDARRLGIKRRSICLAPRWVPLLWSCISDIFLGYQVRNATEKEAGLK
jgi:hypothetical protein